MHVIDPNKITDLLALLDLKHLTEHKTPVANHFG
jgi:hypothetical protein